MIPFPTILENPHLYEEMLIKVNGKMLPGILVQGIRVDPATIPDNRRIFGLRYASDNPAKPLSAVPNKYPILNFLGTFITSKDKPTVKRETAVEYYEYFL